MDSLQNSPEPVFIYVFPFLMLNDARRQVWKPSNGGKYFFTFVQDRYKYSIQYQANNITLVIVICLPTDVLGYCCPEWFVKTSVATPMLKVSRTDLSGASGDLLQMLVRVGE